MQRFKRFYQNAGNIAFAQSIAIFVLMCFILSSEFGSNRWHISVPVLGGTILIGYLLRNILVEYFEAVRIIMNIIAVLGIISVFILPSFIDTQTLPVHIGSLGIIGLYMSSYFFMYSDPRLFCFRP